MPPRRGAGLESRVRQPPGRPTNLFSPLPRLLPFLAQSHLRTLGSLSAVGDFLAPPTARRCGGGCGYGSSGFPLHILLCFSGDPLLSHRLTSSRPPEGYLPFRGRCPTILAFSAVLSFSFFLLFLLCLLSSLHPLMQSHWVHPAPPTTYQECRP